MTTIIQSCLETKFIETTTVKLKVAPPKTLETCSWSFLQVLSNVSSTPKETMEEENVYVHPLTKKYSSSSSRLSEKSLELCTENLGSETGSDDHNMDVSILPLSSSSNSSSNSPTSTENSWLKQEEKLLREVESSSNSKHKKVVNNSRKFPPPLTTISGSNSLQFRPHREDGRLVIQAVEVPLKHTYFQAERSHGRLRLSFLKDHATMFDKQLTRKEEIDEVDDSEDDYDAVDVDIGDNDYQNEDHYQLEEEEDDDDDEMVAYRDMDDNIFDVEVEMGSENFQRLMNSSRCNGGGEHGNKGLICNWPKPLWVGTS